MVRRCVRQRELHVAATAELAGAYVALGHHDRAPDARYLEIRRRMMESGVSMRNFGSAALQLAHVASGRLDGFIELQLSIWDAIGALLLVEEAGGYAAPFAPATPTAKAACLACAPGIAKALADAGIGVGVIRIGSDTHRHRLLPSRNPRHTRTRYRAGSTYLRNAAFADSTVTAAIAASILADSAHVRPRYSCATSEPVSASSCARAMRRSSSTAFFAAAISCAVKPPSRARASSSAVAERTLARFCGAKIA